MNPGALVVLPMLIPMCTAVLCLAVWPYRRVQRAVSLLGTAGLAAAVAALFWHVWNHGTTVTQLGGWPAPFGISFVADPFACVMLAINAAVAVCIVIYAMGAVEPRRESAGFQALVHALITSVSGAFLTGDIFNLFVWFEVMLMSSFVLLALGGTRGQLEGAVKYVTINLLSSTLFLAGVGVIYGIAGTVNMADLAVKLGQAENPRLVTAIGAIFFTCFGIKAAVFPLFFWLPASYQTPPPVITALFAGVLTKVGVYAMIRTFMLIFNAEPDLVFDFFLIISGFTMVVGVFGAAVQTEIRRILAFHSVSQIGYMIMGLAMAGTGIAAARENGGTIPPYAFVAMAGSILFIVHHAIVKTNLFLVSGVVLKLRGTTQLKRLGDLYLTHPILGLLFMISAISLAGLPIFTGFWAKFVLVRAGLEGGLWVIVGVSLFTGVLTLYSMTKIWAEAFWKPTPTEAEIGPLVTDPVIDDRDIGRRGVPVMMVSISIFALLTIGLGVLSGPAYEVAYWAGEELLHPDRYIRAVLGDSALPAPEGGDVSAR